VRILCITLLLGLSNDEDKNLKVKRRTLQLFCFFVIPTLRKNNPGIANALAA